MPMTGRNRSGRFSALHEDCLAQDRPRELKLVSLEPLGNEDSEYVFNIFHDCEQNGNAKHLINSEKSV